MSPRLLIVTPVWNDSARLGEYAPSLAKACSESDLAIRWVIADDGSSKQELAALETLRNTHRKTFPEIHIHSEMHRGKGHVIRSTWNTDPDSHWLAFVDCDGATSARDFLSLINKAIDEQKSVIGIRKRTEQTVIHESAYRWIFHHGYLLVVRLFLGLRSEDLQCGAKVIRGTDYRAVADSLEEDGFCFDTELLTALKAKGFGWLETPINWAEKKGGKVFPLIDSWKMFAGVLRIRGRQP
ncbi:MAG: glycosyltransferase [Luteolibacter sp.]